MKEFYIHDDGIRLHAKLDFPKEMGEKCPLAIIIHGFTGHMEEDHLMAVVEVMNNLGIATLRAEMYGHGGSDGLFENHTLFKWISNVMAVTEYAKTLDFVTDLYLCGHSQGGLLTILAAGMRPDDYKAILPLSPALIIAEGSRTGNMLGNHFDPEHIPEMLYTEKWRLNGNYIRVAQMIHPEDAIQKYHGPVFLIHGNADTTVPVEDTIAAAAKYENCELVIIEGDTHCYEYHLDQVKEAITAFMLQQI